MFHKAPLPCCLTSEPFDVMQLLPVTRYTKLVSVFKPLLRSGGQPQHSIHWPSPHSEPVPCWRVLTGDRAIYMFFDGRETRASAGNPLEQERKNMQTPQQKPLPHPWIHPRTFLLWGDSANHWPTAVPWPWSRMRAKTGESIVGPMGHRSNGFCVVGITAFQTNEMSDQWCICWTIE